MKHCTCIVYFVTGTQINLASHFNTWPWFELWCTVRDIHISLLLDFFSSDTAYISMIAAEYKLMLSFSLVIILEQYHLCRIGFKTYTRKLEQYVHLPVNKLVLVHFSKHQTEANWIKVVPITAGKWQERYIQCSTYDSQNSNVEDILPIVRSMYFWHEKAEIDSGKHHIKDVI